MDCRIATAPNMDLLRQYVSKPTEEEWVYQKLLPPSETELYTMLKTRYGDMQHLSGTFQFAYVASSELGPWCADQVWALALADEVLPKLEASIMKDAGGDPQVLEKAQSDVKRANEASEFVKKYISDNAFRPVELSSKVELLLKSLTEQFVKWPEKKCIVFTERRNTAKVLLQLCQEKRIPNLRPALLVGARKGDLVGKNVTLNQQFLALMNFRKGDVNCLVSLLGNCERAWI